MVRNHHDAWAWGVSNVAPGPGSGVTSNPITQPLVEHWDGHQWRIVATPPIPKGGQLADIVALAPDDAWAVGQQLTGGAENTSNAPLVEHWDGHSWHIVAHPSPPDGVQFGGITALSPDDIWVAGTGNIGSNGAVFEHWDGTQWRIVPSPSSSGIGPLSSHIVLTAISAVSANDIWAAGLRNPAIPFPNGVEPLVEHWDGQRWSIVNSPSLTGTVADLLALGPNDVWAVGTMGMGWDTAQQGQGLVEHWDGEQWSLIDTPTPHPFTSLGGVASDPSTPGKLWIVGTAGPEKGMDQLSDTAMLIETNQ